VQGPAIPSLYAAIYVCLEGPGGKLIEGRESANRGRQWFLREASNFGHSGIIWELVVHDF